MTNATFNTLFAGSALGAEGLQKSVRDAIERKIRRLERAQ